MAPVVAGLGGMMDHVTAVLVVPMTVATNACDAPAPRVTGAGATVTVTGGGAAPDPTRTQKA